MCQLLPRSLVHDHNITLFSTPSFSGWYCGNKIVLLQKKKKKPQWFSLAVGKTEQGLRLGNALGTRICTLSVEKYTQLSRLSEVSGGNGGRI